jgi:hypothetical protein
MAMKSFLTFIFIVSITTIKAQKLDANRLHEFVMECTKTNGEGPNKQMVIWIPYNFWEVIGDQMHATPDFVENMVTQMKDYTMFCVVDYTITNSGMSFKTDEEIRKSIKLTDSSGNMLSPLRESEISADAKHLIVGLQPKIAQIFGQFGEGMRIYIFKAKKINGEPVINVMAKNNFKLKWDTTSLSWALPISSALPPKFCPVDHEQMKGNWSYCPIHGVKLDK